MTLCEFQGLSAMMAIQTIMDKHSNYLHIPLKKNRTLDYLGYKEALIEAAWQLNTEYSKLHGFVKFLLVGGSLGMTLNVWGFQYGSEYMFGTIEVSTPYDCLVFATEVNNKR